MRYEFPLADFETLASAVPSLKEWVRMNAKLDKYIIDKEYIGQIKAQAHVLDRVCQANWSSDFATKSADWEFHPYRIYKLFEIDSFMMIYPYHPDHSLRLDPYIAPVELDFKTQLIQKLHKKLGPKNQGVPTYAEYYEKKGPQLDGNGDPVLDALGNQIAEYTNLLARVDFTITYDAFGFIQQKEAVLKWYREDGKLSEESKDLGKWFDPVLDAESRVQEGILRRQAIIDGLKLPVMDMIRQAHPTKTTLEILTLGRNFLNTHDEAFRDFVDKSLAEEDDQHVDYGKKIAYLTIRDFSDVTHDAWLDFDLGGGNTARQYVLAELDI